MIQNTIKVKNQTLHLDFEVRVSPSGRPYRHSGVSLVLNEPSVWIDRVMHHKTIYYFKYVDATGGFFAFKFDQYGKFECIVNC